MQSTPSYILSRSYSIPDIATDWVKREVYWSYNDENIYTLSLDNNKYVTTQVTDGSNTLKGLVVDPYLR